MYWLLCLIVINNWTRLSTILWFVSGEQIHYWQRNDQWDTAKSRYFATTEFNNCFVIPNFIISEFVFQWISAIFTQEQGEKRGFIYAWAEYYLHSWMALRMSRALYVGSYLQVTWVVLSQWKGRKIRDVCTHPEFWKKRKISLVWCKTSHEQIVPRTAKKCQIYVKIMTICLINLSLHYDVILLLRPESTTRILQDFAFWSKLEVLLFKPRSPLPNLDMKGKTKRILVIVKWRHYANVKTLFSCYRVFSHDVTAAILVSQNNETAAMLVSQTNPVGVGTLFLCKRFLLFQTFAYMLATWVKTLLVEY